MMQLHKFYTLLVVAMGVCLLIYGNFATAEPPLSTAAAAASQQHTETQASALVKAHKPLAKNLSAANSIELLLDEISQLKLELVPDSLQQQAGKSGKVGAQREPKQIVERATSLLDELKLEQQATAVSQATKAQQRSHVTEMRKSPNAGARHERQLSVCDKSLAVGTLGYRMLCPQHKTIAAKQQITLEGLQTSTEAAEELRRRSDAMNFNVTPQASTTTTTTSTPAAALTRSEELKRLKMLLDKLIRNGNFRPLASDGPAPEVR